MTRRTATQVALASLVVLARVAATIWSGAVVSPDTARYRDPVDRLSPFEVWNGEGPGVLLQVLYLLPADVAVVVQTAFAAGCWAVAATYLAAGVRASRWSWLCWAVVIAAGLSPWFLLWDAWMITEAVTCGAVALGAVGMVGWRRGRDLGMLLTAIGVTAAVLARPFVGVLILPVLVLALWWPNRRVQRGSRGVAVMLITVLGGFSAWQLVALQRAAALPYADLPHAESLRTIQATDRLAGRGDVPGYLALARRHGMPGCPEAKAVVQSRDTVFTKVVELRRIESCPDLDRWLEQGGLSWVTELTQNSAPTFSEMLDPAYWLDDSFEGYVYSHRLLELRELAGARWKLTVRIVNGVMLAWILVAVVVGVASARGDRGWLLLATAWSATVFVVAWGTGGMEYWRHVLPVFVLLAMLGMAASLPDPRRSHRPADPGSS